MQTLNEAKYLALLTLTGATPPATINELEVQRLAILGYVTGTLEERYHAFFDDDGVPAGTFNERIMFFFDSRGYDEGTINERMYQWYLDGGYLPIPANLYPNPTLIGGSNIVADVYATAPANHYPTTFAANPADATYLGAGNPAYTFVGTGNSRFQWGVNVNTATSRSVTLPAGRSYRFSAKVQSIGEAAVVTRLINLSAGLGGTVITVDGASVIPDGTVQSVYIDFVIPTVASSCQLRHGIGLFNAVTTVGATQQTTDLDITDIGALPLLFDNFTDVDQTLLINHVPNIGVQATQFGADLSPKIVGGAVLSSIAGRQVCGYDIGQVNKRITYNVIGIGNIVVFRLRQDVNGIDQNFIYVNRTTTLFQIIKLEGGVAATLATVSKAFVSGERIVITDDGNTITASVDGTLITANNTFQNTLTLLGLQVNGINTSIKNLLIEDLV